MAASGIDAVRGIGEELQALSRRLRDLTASNPAIHSDLFVHARGQINSAVRYIELAILKAMGPGAAPPL